MNKLTLTQAIEKMTSIQNNPELLSGSLYSAQDVINILKSIKQPTSLPANWKSELCEVIENMIDEELSSEFVDYDEVEFQLNGNEISLESVGVNTRAVRRAVEYLVEDRITEILTSDDEQDNEEITNDQNEENEQV